jgi:glycosyltransferase involved in cell wall biosynthesis
MLDKLTICIPTYNRDPFLAWTLDRTYKTFPTSRVIVSDNAKSQLTFNQNTRYIRQPGNIGAFNNMRAALLSAHTKYAVFLGDDDYLLPEQVSKGIEYLEAHPEVIVYYAPCQLYDEVADKAAWEAFYPGGDETFTHADSLWNFIIGKHVWPEHAIYRRERLEEILQPRTSAYWCFVDLANAALRGAVHFAATPYYRNITNHPVGARSKMGDQQCLVEFDSYTAGLQCLAHDIFQGHFDQTLKVNINAMIRNFIWSRFEVASRILTAQNRLVEAAVLRKRMEITGY